MNAASVKTFEGVEVDQMYREHILDHYKNPRNVGTCNGLSFKDHNPLCGDEIEMSVEFVDDKVNTIKFIGKGCAISQATASLLTDFVKNKSVEEITKITRDDMQDLLGIKMSVMRVKCMMLSLKVLKTICYKHEGKNTDLLEDVK